MRYAKSGSFRATIWVLTLVLASVIGPAQVFAATESVIWSFGNGTDGAAPYGGLISDSIGNLYGTTYQGGANGTGTVFELTPPATGGGTWTEFILWNFDNNGGPLAGLIVDGSGNLYGTTSGNANLNYYPFNSGGGGNVFKLSPPATGGTTWTEKTLWTFNNGSGTAPYGGLLMDKGNLYGTTADGAFYCTYSSIYGPVCGGTVFELTPTRNR